MLKLQPSKRLGLIACGIILGAMLAACGRDNSPPPAPATPSPVAQFINFVSNIVGSGANETDEPTDISAVNPATTETDEPTTL